MTSTNEIQSTEVYHSKRDNISSNFFLNKYDQDVILKENEMLKGKVKLIPELESKILVLEQNEQNLKRNRQILQMEISELKIHIEKHKIEEDNYTEEFNVNSKVNDTLNNLTLKEAKEIINELLEEIEEIKREKNEISEKALNMLMEKELANMDLREKLEETKNNQYLEINNIAREMYFRDNKIGVTENTNKKNEFQEGDENNSSDKDPPSNNHQETDKISVFEDEKLVSNFDEERNLLYKKINELEEQLTKLNSELETKDLHRQVIENIVNKDKKNENEIFTEMQNLYDTIRYLEEKNLKNENNFKEYSNKLKEELEDYHSTNKNFKMINEKLENELNLIKKENQVIIKNMNNKNKYELSMKEKEIRNLQLKLEEWNREKVFLQNELEIFKKNSEINKESYYQLQSKLLEIKENYNKQKKVYEDKLVSNEKRFESEKNALIVQLTTLQLKINQMASVSSQQLRRKTTTENIYNRKRTSEIQSQILSNELKFIIESSSTSNQDETENSSSYAAASQKDNYESLATLECVDLENEDTSPEATILELENRIEVYESQINELNLKINQLNKKEKENEILKIENSNLKENVELLRTLYEDQIKELQKNNLIMNAELLSKRKVDDLDLNTTSKSLYYNNFEKINENLIKMNNLTIEVDHLKFILENEKKSRQEDLIKSEEELSDLKIQVAQLYFEKESAIVKFNNERKKTKKLIDKYRTMMCVKK